MLVEIFPRDYFCNSFFLRFSSNLDVNFGPAAKHATKETGYLPPQRFEDTVISRTEIVLVRLKTPPSLDRRIPQTASYLCGSDALRQEPSVPNVASKHIISVLWID